MISGCGLASDTKRFHECRGRRETIGAADDRCCARHGGSALWKDEEGFTSIPVTTVSGFVTISMIRLAAETRTP
jgi:hypothetical protein